MTLIDMRDWLASELGTEEITIGKIDGGAQQVLGVFPLNVSNRQRVAIGGLPQTLVEQTGMRILVHWTNDLAETEAVASAVYDLFYAKTNTQIGATRVYLLDPKAEPIYLGTDSRGVYEYVIEVTLTHERS